MNKNNLSIGEIGDNFRKFKKIRFNSNDSLLDYDLVFLDINFISYLFDPQNAQLDEIQVDINVEKTLIRRRNDLDEFLRNGKILVTYLPRVQVYKFVERHYLMDRDFVNIALFPFLLPVITNIGENIEILGKTKFSTLLNKHSNIFFYKSYLPWNSSLGIPIAKIRNTDKIIALEKGNILILPSIVDMLPGSSTEIIDDFGEDLINFLFPKVEIEIPIWTNNFYLKGERQVINEIAELNDQKNRLMQDILSREERLSKIRRRKTLFFGTGKTLEDCIEEIFKELGFTILQKDNFRDDLIVQYGDKIAIVEIKGVTKSAAEDHAAQLEKWVSEYTLGMKKVPKGILVVNAFREKELDKRNENTFPNQMIKYSKNRDHCLISGLQLLGLYNAFVSDPSNKEQLINTLFETEGIYEGYESWRDFIELD